MITPRVSAKVAAIVMGTLALSISGCHCGSSPPGGTHNDGGPNGSPDVTFVGMDANTSDTPIVNVGQGGSPDSSVAVVVCPGCPCFPGTDCTAGGQDAGMPAACTDQTEAPTLIYPPDQVLFPPNTNAIEVQFEPGKGNTLFEVDFENNATDVRFITGCTAISNTRMGATGGCGFTLDANDWHFIAEVNRGGDPLHVKVRATSGTCVGQSASRDMLFASEDLIGAIYYWQSVTVDGVPGKAGGIYRYDFGRPDLPPEAFLASSPATNNRCIGCHFVSRDGLRISYGSDDPDSDDEYGDVTSRLMDISNRMILGQTIVPGFRTFTHDHADMLASNGRGFGGMGPGGGSNASFIEYGGDNGQMTASVMAGAKRGTQPDWAPDDSKVLFVEPSAFLLNRGGGTSMTTGDDSHFIGGSLFTMTWSGGQFGTPAPLLMSAGENNYYPAYSPDGAFVIFNRVENQGGMAGDAFSNPNARIWAMPSGGGTPVDLARLNQADGLSNSWPRWSQFVQKDRGHSILWVTFSSIRDYGLRVQNQDPHGTTCYPPDSPENLNPTHQCPLVPSACNCVAAGCPSFCVQPQIWMAAVEVDSSGGISTGTDTSHPAFWLPFQEITAHNHIAQWVQQVPGHGVDGGPPPGSEDSGVPDPGNGSDAGPGSCGMLNANCGATSSPCCTQFVCAGGMCTAP
jgi:hypothetical protein